MILVLDNRDSFTFNLAHALAGLGADVQVRSARETNLEEIRSLSPERVLIGPGPGKPVENGLSASVVRSLAGEVPILGVCFGHQAIAAAFGSGVASARSLRHGSTARIEHDGHGILRGLPLPFRATVYHSLVVDESELHQELEVSARDEHGDVMGLRHRELSLEGVQFHPEALRSEGATRLFENFLRAEV